MKLYMFRTVHLSTIRSFHFTHSNGKCQQTCMTYTIAVCSLKNSWWWTEELSETCRVSFQEKIWEISASSWFYYKKFITMHGHMNVKLRILVRVLASLTEDVEFKTSFPTFF